MGRFAREDAQRYHANDGVAERFDPIAIPLEQSIGQDARPLRGRRVARWLDATDDDVGRALAFDVVQGVLHRPLAERHEQNHRRDADDDAEHRQKSAELVQPQALNGQRDAALELDPRAAEAEPGEQP